jgi:hypothetical protein
MISKRKIELNAPCSTILLRRIVRIDKSAFYFSRHPSCTTGEYKISRFELNKSQVWAYRGSLNRYSINLNSKYSPNGLFGAYKKALDILDEQGILID